MRKNPLHERRLRQQQLICAGSSSCPYPYAMAKLSKMQSYKIKTYIYRGG